MPIDPRIPASAGDFSGVTARIADMTRQLNLLMSQRTVIGNGQITGGAGGMIASGAITTVNLTAGAVQAGQISAGAIQAGALQANAVIAGNIAALAIQAGALQAASVIAGNLAANSIISANIQADQITTRELAANAVYAENILSGAVSAEKITVSSLSAITGTLGSINFANGVGSISTSASGARVVLDSLGLRGYALDGVSKTFEINAGSGVASFAGVATLDGSSIVPGGTISGDNTLPGSRVVSNSIDTLQLKAGSVVANTIAAGAITATKLTIAAIAADGTLASGSVGNTQITPNSITADKIIAVSLAAVQANVTTLSSITADIGTVTAGALNGITITGSTVRTAASGARVELNSGGLIGYNGAGTPVVSISSTDGSFAATGGSITGGTFRTSAAVDVSRISFDSAGLKSYAADGVTANVQIKTDGSGLSLTSLPYTSIYWTGYQGTTTSVSWVVDGSNVVTGRVVGGTDGTLGKMRLGVSPNPDTNPGFSVDAAYIDLQAGVRPTYPTNKIVVGAYDDSNVYSNFTERILIDNTGYSDWCLNLYPINTADITWYGAFSNGWRNYGNGYKTLQAVRVGKVVHVSGLIAKGPETNGPGSGSYIADEVMFTLPAGYRPAQTVICMSWMKDRAGVVNVGSSGNVTMRLGGLTNPVDHVSVDFSFLLV